MDTNKIVVDVQPRQTRVALVENGQLAEYYVERPGRERLAGNIYKGRVVNVLPGMDAAFVDIGLARNAFLYAGDIVFNSEEFEFESGGKKERKDPVERLPIGKLVKPGQELMVQVVKDPVGSKGARITTHITLPGRLLVLMPTVDYVGVSRRIDEEEERARIKAMADEVRPKGCGLIARTAARDIEQDKMAEELRGLLAVWEQLTYKCNHVNAPYCVFRDSDLLVRAVRDMLSADITGMYVNDQAAYESMRDLATRLEPELVDRIHLHGEGYDIFDDFSLEEKVDKSFARRVWLKSGGYLIFDHTEALCVIDVNTGKYVGERDLQRTILKTNLEAAAEIAHQVRLRDIGGIIVIDFIDMLDSDSQQQVVQTLKDALKRDRTRTNVVGMTGLGLVEMTRKKVRQRVSVMMQTTCPYCGGSGLVLTAESVAQKILKELRIQRAKTGETAYVLKVHADVADYLEREHLLDADIEVYRSRSAHIEQYRLSPADDWAGGGRG